jgi:hypothetical protein
VAQADLMIIFVRVLGNAVVEGCNSMALGFSFFFSKGGTSPSLCIKVMHTAFISLLKNIATDPTTKSAYYKSWITQSLNVDQPTKER